MNLYLLSTKKLDDFYLLANNPLEAQTSLEHELNKADYGFYDDRKVVNIRLLAEEIEVANKSDKLNFSSKKKLIIVPILHPCFDSKM